MKVTSLAAMAVAGLTMGFAAAAAVPTLPMFEPDPYWPKQQRFFYVPDGTNKKVQIVDREAMEVVGWFGGIGGHGLGEFSHIHSIATDSKGNIYLGEVDTGRRVYRWNVKGRQAR